MPYEVVCKVTVWLAEKGGDLIRNSDEKAFSRGVPGLFTSASEASEVGEPVRAVLTVERHSAATEAL